MDKIRNALAPLTDWIPDEYRGLMPAEAWWLGLLVAALVVLLLRGRILRGRRRVLSKRRGREVDGDRPLRLVLEECPLPVRPPGQHALLAYHMPVRLRLVVLAPGGKDADIDATAV